MKKILISIMCGAIVTTGLCANAAQKYDNSSQEYNKTIQNTKDFIENLGNEEQDFNIFDLYEMLTKADKFIESGDYYSAMKIYNKLLEISPDNAGAYALRGLLNSHYLENYEGALRDFSSAIKYNPNEASNYAQRGFVRMKLGDDDGALNDFAKAISINKQNGTQDAFVYCTRGLVYGMKGNYEAAISDTTEAIKIQPKYPAAFHFRGMAKMNLALKKMSLPLMNSALQDLGYAKEQCLQLDNMDEYQDVLSTYKKALKAKDFIAKEVNRKK